MKSEEIIMLVFVGLLIIGVPIILWLLEREKREEEKQNRPNSNWSNKNK